jgi:hypothetical protein
MAYSIYAPLNFALKGLLGEHIVDHHVIEQKNWGLQWNRHDMRSPARGGKKTGWQSEYKKINDLETPLYLCTPSAHVLTSGIDSLWFTNRGLPHQFAVVEAKASMNPAAKLLNLLGEANAEDAPSGGSRRKGNRQRATRAVGTATHPKQPKEKVLQMSHQWIEKRIRRDFRSLTSRIDSNYSRHVFLVTPDEAVQHVAAALRIIADGMVGDPVKAQEHAADHSTHNVKTEFGEAELDAANKNYIEGGKPKKPGRRKP